MTPRGLTESLTIRADDGGEVHDDMWPSGNHDGDSPGQEDALTAG